MNDHERLKQFAEKHGKVITEQPAKKQMKDGLKGKQSLTRKEIDDLMVQVAKDLGYI